jgi:hypothetical protein
MIRNATGRTLNLSAEKMVGGASGASTFSNTSPKFDFETLHMKDAKPQNLKDEEGFYDSFNSCMSLQGIPVPSSAFQSVAAAITTINTIYSAVSTFGTSVTFAELIEAGAMSEYFAAAGALTASYYLGACIGCAINAGVSAADLPSFFG